MSNYLDSLNESQRKAVLQMNGPMIIIAGAGSGKTRVLTYRVAYLLENGVDAFNILSLTFTNKSAKEMKQRIIDTVGSEGKNLWMGTFHSVFARILRSESSRLGFPSNFTIYDSQDSVRLIGAIVREMQLDKDRYKSKQVLSRISQFKNNLITVKAYFGNPEYQEDDKKASRPRMGDIYKEYVDRCFKAGAMDFDDLLLRTNELLTRFPDVLAKYQDRFRYIMVDEYQDTNHSQYLIVKALADRFQNICVVGDDSQSIYAFRGANIQNILNFQKDYKDVRMFKLEQNYRSSGNIVQAANSVIDKNKTKIEKDVWTANEQGAPVKVMRTTTDGEEGRFVAENVFETAMNEQLKYSDFCVLYRTNSQSRAFEDAFRKKGIKYRIYGGLSFYQRKEIKDTLGYLRLLVNQNDEEALKRVINYPPRGIGATTIDKLAVAANHYKKSIYEILEHIDQIDLKINAGTKTKLRDFVTMIKTFQIAAETSNAFEVADLVVKKTKLIKDLDKDGTPEGISKVENVQELLNGLKDFIVDQKEKEEDASLAFFLEDVALASDLDGDDKDDEPRVAMMTIHMSKGLEFPIVYVVGLEENLFPSAMSMTSRADLEEERRLFYVALTRAERQAYLSYTRNRYRWGKLVDCEPSRFLGEIDEQYLEFLTTTSEPLKNKYLDEDIFGELDVRTNYTPKPKIRFKKPALRPSAKKGDVKRPSLEKKMPPRKLKKVVKASIDFDFSSEIKAGNFVMHTKFGKGEVLTIEGEGANQKAEIKFPGIGSKKLLLQFAKLKIIK
ncbi:MAG: ATP-dependent DNA helicase [Flavobacteriaceae bacterium]|nr:MAG: ATP-dependent DNA helicase [Flavobacteriaceae bacterium]